jgi:hypothetical protein
MNNEREKIGKKPSHPKQMHHPGICEQELSKSANTSRVEKRHGMIVAYTK